MFNFFKKKPSLPSVTSVTDFKTAAVYSPIELIQIIERKLRENISALKGTNVVSYKPVKKTGKIDIQFQEHLINPINLDTVKAHYENAGWKTGVVKENDHYVIFLEP